MVYILFTIQHLPLYIYIHIWHVTLKKAIYYAKNLNNVQQNRLIQLGCVS